MSQAIIQKNDTVIARSGSSAGKTGKVIEVNRLRSRALVEGLNIVKKTVKRSNETPQGGIVEVEAPIQLSNLMLYCPECKKGVRIHRERRENGPVRTCASSGCSHVFDS